MGIATGGISGQLGQAVAGISKLWGTEEQAPDVAQPQLGQAQTQLECRGALAPLGTAHDVGAFALVLALLLAGQEPSLLVQALADRRSSHSTGRLGGLEQPHPASLPDVTMQRRAYELLGALAQGSAAL